LLQECQRVKTEQLLAQGRLPIKQIADEVGFSSVQSFHRAFRRWSGQTPQAWRQALGLPEQAAARTDADTAPGSST
jgi:AraC-like DNA-binding protein